MRAKLIKMLEENTDVNLHDSELGNSFLDMTPSAKETKGK